uniref:piggyBac transposable element-derived protein 4-like n=1 Tax=Monopterus albus TaxID=43700 RepID=UPI0009B33461|nr:piggyBac transposable element-derived protein 4-like [Monopterus albus]
MAEFTASRVAEAKRALDRIFAQPYARDTEDEDDRASEASEADDNGDRHDGSEGNESEHNDTFLSKDKKIEWSSVPLRDSDRVTVPQHLAGPTAEAKAGAQSILSSFLLFFTPELEQLVLAATNREGSRTRDSWKQMDVIDLRAYVGLLILAGVYRSRGEAAASLWDAECGRAIFRATMSLKDFYLRSKTLRFDDRESRAERHSDKLAAIREVWDMWRERLPALYVPGPEVTVDERMVPFKGRCAFRQYMPKKPARYGLKLWVLCDANSSYAWKMQEYMGRAGNAGARTTNLASQVVTSLTQGLEHRLVTCNNFFTSYELARSLLLKNITMLGTIRRNKPELPPESLSAFGREVFSTRFAFSDLVTLVSYVPRKNKTVLLLITKHSRPEVDETRRDKKPRAILDYNRTKGGVDNLDKLLAAYSCRRMTKRWPVAMFHNILDVSAFNAFVIWRETHPDWMPEKRNRRRLFLERLGKDLVTPLIMRRKHAPRAESARALIRTIRGPSPTVTPPRSEKRKRCQVCPREKDAKTHTVCTDCRKYICGKCTWPFCAECAGISSEDTGES